MQVPHFAHWTETIALISFVVSVLVFLFVIVAVAHIPKSRIRRLGEFPLQNDEHPSHESEKER
jgi:hypothetical protein